MSITIGGAGYPSASYVQDSNGNWVPVSPSNPASVQLIGSTSLTGALQLVTTAGTRVQLPNIPCREVTIIGKRLNTGYIYVGGNNVSSTVYGAELGAKDSITIAATNANLIFIDASVSGEGVSYVAI